MTSESTVQPPATDHSAAPELTPTVQAEQAASGPFPGNAAPQRNTPAKREKTAGEHLFDWGTYGGFSTIGNEVLSFFIMSSAAKGMLKPAYDKFARHFTGIKATRYIPEYVTKGRLPYLLFATIGGMFTVLPVKFSEDHKGTIVRKLDHFFHGDKINTDPQYIQAHQEMEEAPKQSWGSLLKGRVVTVFAAIGADSIFGWEHAVTTKLIDKTPLKNTWVRKFSSLHNFSTTLAGALVDNVFKLTGPNRDKWFERAVTGGWLLTLSTTLTVLFYASSKMFARKSEERHEEKIAARMGIPYTPPSHPLLDAPEQAELSADAPSPKVSQITRDREPLAAAPAPALSA